MWALLALAFSAGLERRRSADECVPYENSNANMKFMTVAHHCRDGLNPEWPGGITCNSPYVICLPKENTPTTRSKTNPTSYLPKDHDYTVDECKTECARDQRCLGIEFRANWQSNKGHCYLIDDVPLVAYGASSGWSYDGNENAPRLDSEVVGDNALCFEKKDYCNPHFEANQLSDLMLNCYCPNNRKGFYTGSVERTVAVTRHCGGDPETTERIKKAQANRMFHLCENWCLFDTDDPNSEAWYWDPWEKCFRSQFAGFGTSHQTYCYRTISVPFTIEMQFVNYRAKNFCKTPTVVTTEKPPTTTPDMVLADELQSCTEACKAKNGQRCLEAKTSSITSDLNKGQIMMEFNNAGVACTYFADGLENWALPGLKIDTNTCVSRHPDTKDVNCGHVLGTGYRRLCACNPP